jgi:hypothetical protein
VPIKSALAMTMRTNQRIVFSLQDAGPHPLVFVPDSTAFFDFLETGRVHIGTNLDRIYWTNIHTPADHWLTIANLPDLARLSPMSHAEVFRSLLVPRWADRGTRCW